MVHGSPVRDRTVLGGVAYLLQSLPTFGELFPKWEILDVFGDKSREIISLGKVYLILLC